MITVWHHEACRVMTIGDPEGRFFYPTLKRIMNSFSCSPLFLFIYFLKKLLEVPGDAKMQFHMMTLLDVLGKIAWVREDFLSHGKISECKKINAKLSNQ